MVIASGELIWSWCFALRASLSLGILRSRKAAKGRESNDHDKDSVSHSITSPQLRSVEMLQFTVASMEKPAAAEVRQSRLEV